MPLASFDVKVFVVIVDCGVDDHKLRGEFCNCNLNSSAVCVQDVVDPSGANAQISHHVPRWATVRPAPVEPTVEPGWPRAV